MEYKEINFGKNEGGIETLKYWVTRQLDGKYMLTQEKPVLSQVIGEREGVVDYFPVYGDPIALRGRCHRILRMFSLAPMSRLESVHVEILPGRRIADG